LRTPGWPGVRDGGGLHRSTSTERNAMKTLMRIVAALALAVLVLGATGCGPV
jgi:hypothetical protein